MWRDYFKNGNVFGIDIEDHKSYSRKLKGIKCFIGDASDDSFLSKVESKVAGGFDIIIDDASHEPSHQISGFECLFSKLNKGGIYVVEDLHTSYENKDISSYINAVDYFKRLVDEVNFNGKNKYQNFNRIKEEIMKESTYYERTIESICFHMGICFIFKRKV